MKIVSECCMLLRSKDESVHQFSFTVDQTPEEFRKLYMSALPMGAYASAHAAYAYDTVWALAAALNATDAALNGSVVSKPINFVPLMEGLKGSSVKGVSVCMYPV